MSTPGESRGISSIITTGSVEENRVGASARPCLRPPQVGNCSGEFILRADASCHTAMERSDEADKIIGAIKTTDYMLAGEILSKAFRSPPPKLLMLFLGLFFWNCIALKHHVNRST